MSTADKWIIDNDRDEGVFLVRNGQRVDLEDVAKALNAVEKYAAEVRRVEKDNSLFCDELKYDALPCISDIETALDI